MLKPLSQPERVRLMQLSPDQPISPVGRRYRSDRENAVAPSMALRCSRGGRPCQKAGALCQATPVPS